MAGINRLGKAPPKPGTLRPPDPNKYRTVDMYSEGAEADMDYQKTVRDIEEMQQQQGWLFGRGAFDKADLLYLRDTAEQQRHMELELRDNECNQFAAMRARMEQQQQQPEHKPANSQRTKERDKAVQPAAKAQPKAVPLVVPKLRSSSTAQVATERSASEPPTKKLRPDFSEKAEATTSDTNHNKVVSDDNESADGLLGLLGAYGSDSEEHTSDDGERDADKSRKEQPVEQQQDNASGSKPAITLPSAAELLGL